MPWLVERRGRSTHHLFTIHARPGERDALLSKLGAAGIGTAVNYRAIHLLTYLAELLGSRAARSRSPRRSATAPSACRCTRRSAVEEQDRVVEAVAAAW